MAMYSFLNAESVGFDEIKALLKFTSVIQATNVCKGRLTHLQKISKTALKYFRRSEDKRILDNWQASYNNTEM